VLERKLVADVRGIDATTHFEGCPPIAIIGKQLVIAVGFIPIVQAAMPLFILLLEWRAEESSLDARNESRCHWE